MVAGNFLRYMRQHFGLDRLIEHGSQPLPEATSVVNPARRRLEQSIRRERSRLRCLGSPVRRPHPPQRRHDGLKNQRQNTARKVPLKDLPEGERYRQLCPESKHFIDTIKMIAYCAESALTGELREHLNREDDARFAAPGLCHASQPAPGRQTEKPAGGTLPFLGSLLQDAAIAKLC